MRSRSSLELVRITTGSRLASFRRANPLEDFETLDPGQLEVEQDDDWCGLCGLVMVPE